MAHQTEIVINGVTTEVTEFDHTAQEIDDGIDKVNTLTGEDIPTSASDSTSISSQLSKKAEWMPNNWKTEADAPSAYPLNSATTFFSGNSFAGIDQCIVTTYAYNLNAARQIVSFLDNTGVKYRLAIGEDQWGAWKQISTATPPQEFDLPLASGFSNGGGGNSVYWKDQFNQVHFLVSVTNQNSLSSGDVIATLPAGFRPSKTAIFVLGSLVSAVRKTGSLNVKSDGSIVYFGEPLSSGVVSFGAGAFVAAG